MKEGRQKKHTVWFYLFEVEEQERLIYGGPRWEDD